MPLKVEPSGMYAQVIALLWRVERSSHHEPETSEERLRSVNYRRGNGGVEPEGGRRSRTTRIAPVRSDRSRGRNTQESRGKMQGKSQAGVKTEQENDKKSVEAQHESI